jgi:hypothetical protein
MTRYRWMTALIVAVACGAASVAQAQYVPRRPAARAAGATVRGAERATRGAVRGAEAALPPYRRPAYGPRYGARPYAARPYAARPYRRAVAPRYAGRWY